MVSAHARRSAGATGPHGEEHLEAKRALSASAPAKASRLWTTSLAVAASVACAGLVLSAAAPLGRSATAAPAVASGTVTRDVPLSRGDVDRQALSEASRAPAQDSATEEPSADASPSAAAQTAYYVLSLVNLRDAPSTSGNVVDTLAAGTQVTGVGDAADGWQAVTAGDAKGYVKSSLLTTTPPAAKTATPAARTSTAAAKTSTGVNSSYPACPSGSDVEVGLVPNAILVHRAVCATFPDITTYGGIRGDGSEHSTGHALDIMTSGARGQQIAAWLQANYSKLGIVEIIYQQQIWTTQRASEGWRAMPDRGSITANHYDHIHVLVG